MSDVDCGSGRADLRKRKNCHATAAGRENQPCRHQAQRLGKGSVVGLNSYVGRARQKSNLR